MWKGEEASAGIEPMIGLELFQDGNNGIVEMSFACKKFDAAEKLSTTSIVRQKFTNEWQILSVLEIAGANAELMVTLTMDATKPSPFFEPDAQ